MLQQLVTESALDPKNPYKIFEMAREYDKLEQGAMAIGLYLRAADIEEDDKDFQYKCMIYMAEAYRRQKDRRQSVMMSLQHAVRLRPTRPEALYLMIKSYEQWGDWRNLGVYAELGLRALDLEEIDDPITDVGYPGKFAFYYAKALASWRWTGAKEARDLIFNFQHRIKKGPWFTKLINDLANETGYPHSITYTQKDYDRYKFKFDGLEKIKKNYSAHFQDMFVLSLLNGKREGTYVELGSSDPFINNNTALLEKEFGWKGLSVDKSERFAYDFSCRRDNTIICEDATNINYSSLFHQLCFDQKIDLLQIDCDKFSLDALKAIPFGEYQFSIIQFTHNHGHIQSESRDISRKILQEHGYVLVVNDAANDPHRSFEDWWVHPHYVNIPENMMSQSKINFVWNYMMNTELLQDVKEYVD